MATERVTLPPLIESAAVPLKALVTVSSNVPVPLTVSVFWLTALASCYLNVPALSAMAVFKKVQV